MKCDGCFGASFDDCKRCKKMTGKEYQKLAMRTCSIPYDNKEGRLHHAVFGLTSEAGEVAGILQKVYQGHEFDKDHIGLSTLFQTNFFRLFFRYCTGV